MKRRSNAAVLLAVSALVAIGVASTGACIGSTGGELVDIDAFAAGPARAIKGQPLEIETGRGYHVVLTRAVLHIGAVYLDEAVPTSVASDTSCFLPGIYVVEVTEGLDVDVLDPTPQKFPGAGFATTTRARTGEIWLTGGPIDQVDDPTVILSLKGTAERDGTTYPFEAELTIAANRLPPADPAQPGAHPICKERIVTPLSLDLTPTDGGTMMLRIDPAGWFANVDFSLLEQVETDPPRYRFADDGSDAPSRNLYAGVRANAGVYSLEWEP